MGRPIVGTGAHRSDVRWMLATKHLVGSAREIRAGTWGARDFLATVRPPVVDGVFDLRDPRPMLSLYRRSLGARG